MKGICKNCGRAISFARFWASSSRSVWAHTHSDRVACDEGHDGHISLAEPEIEV